MQKVIFIICCSYLLPLYLVAQKKYWQQQVNYTIDVTLNDTEHTLDGMCTMEYINNSPDTLKFIWVHLWMNAFKNDKTAFSEQQLQKGNTSFYFSNDNEKGYINRLNFQENKQTLQVQDHPNYIDIVRVTLSQPLVPGATTIITTPFHSKIPKNFSRGGHIGNHYQITQWYPKAAMYDATGWHEMPYVDQGEFYNNFGNYNVSITLPSNYAVAATGSLQNTEEKIWLTQRNNFTIPKSLATKNNTDKKNNTPKINFTTTTKTLQYLQNNVVDFAWFASKEYLVDSDSLILASGKKIYCQSFYYEKNKTNWQKSMEYLKRSLVFRSEMIGEYPFETATIVDASMGFSGGMEYPTITSIAGSYNDKQLDLVIEHEIGHNWFQGILATNERINPWMDEGLNTYYDNKYEAKYYPVKENKKKGILAVLGEPNTPLKVMSSFRKDQPINTSSYDFTMLNYALIAYQKTADWLEFIETKTRKDSVEKAIQNYYKLWQFKHPSPNDFDSVMQKTVPNYNNYATLRGKTGMLEKDTKNRYIFAPIFGYNYYDKSMLGIGTTNYLSLGKNTHFYIAPLYSFKTKSLNGLVRIAYKYYPKNTAIERIDAGLGLQKYTINTFTTLHLGMQKITPFVRLNFKPKSKSVAVVHNIMLRHFNIAEDNLRFTLVQNPSDTFYMPSKIKQSYYVNQLQWNYKNLRALYPFDAQLQLEQSKDIIRSTLTATQFFNYNSKGQGLWVRAFVGKIVYLKTKNTTLQYNNDRYALNLLAPKGNEDYTYSNYFVGRNEFDHGSAKQILQRDGFFKFRTDLLASKPGRTDNWLAAANFVSDIPNRLNPLSILPIKLPIKFFMDFGTFAEAWQKNYSGTKFLYSGGLQLSILKNTIEIYYPFINSKAFKDYSLQIWQKKNSTKNISFAINLNTFSLRKLVPQINY